MTKSIRIIQKLTFRLIAYVYLFESVFFLLTVRSCLLGNKQIKLLHFHKQYNSNADE